MGVLLDPTSAQDMLLRLGPSLVHGGAPRPLLPANAQPIARAYALVMSDRQRDGEQQLSDDLSSNRNFKWGGDEAEATGRVDSDMVNGRYICGG